MSDERSRDGAGCMRTFARGMMERKETAGRERPDVMRLEESHTDEYKGILVRFGEVQGPLGTRKTRRVNQLVFM